MDDLELIGMDYIWRLVLNSCEDIANKAIELLEDCFTILGNLRGEQLILLFR